MDQIGYLDAPSGVVPDFNRGLTSVQIIIIVLFSVTYALATLFLVLRLYTSAFINKGVDVGDFLVIASWAVAGTFFVYSAKAMPYGYGRHGWDVSVAQIEVYFSNLVPMTSTYFWAPTLTKLAMLALFYHINPEKPFRMGLYILAAAITVYTMVFTILFAGPCNPLSAGTSDCVNNIGAAHAGVNIATDIIMILYPVPMVHKLKMPLKQRITVGLLMTLGSCCIIASIGRIAYVRALTNNPDVTWTQAGVGVWSTLELNIGLICISLARLKPFVKRYLPRLASFGGFNATEGKSSSRNWGGTSGHHTYQLHSVQASSSPFPLHDKSIHVVSEYNVHSARENGDNDSTEIILDKTGDTRRGA